MIFLANLAFSFHSGISIPTTSYFKCKTDAKYDIGPNLTQILPQRPYLLSFSFADFINLNNLCCNPVVLRKIGKPLKSCFLGPNCTEKGSWWDKMKNIFFKQNYLQQIICFQKIFILSKYHMFWLSYESFSILSNVFQCSKVHLVYV